MQSIDLLYPLISDRFLSTEISATSFPVPLECPTSQYLSDVIHIARCMTPHMIMPRHKSDVITKIDPKRDYVKEFIGSDQLVKK